MAPRWLPTNFQILFWRDYFNFPASFIYDWTDRGVSISIQRGQNRFDGQIPPRYDAATMTLVLRNEDGQLDPSNSSSTYYDANGTWLKPEKTRFQIWGNGHPIFTGYTDSWTVDYPEYEKLSTVTIRCTDRTKVLSNFNGDPQTPVGDFEFPGTRINRILDYWGGLDFIDRDISINSQQSLVPTVLQGNPWQEMQLVADCCFAELFWNAGGTIVFRDLVDQLAFFTLSSVTLKDNGVNTGTQLKVSGLGLNVDSTQVRNQVTIWDGTGTESATFSSPTVNDFYERKYERTDLPFYSDLNSPSNISNYASIVRYALEDAKTRVEYVTINPLDDPTNAYPMICQLDLGHRVAFDLKALPGRGTVTPYQQQHIIRGIQHDIRPDGWLTTYALQTTEDWNYLVFDSVNQGAFDANRFGIIA